MSLLLNSSHTGRSRAGHLLQTHSGNLEHQYDLALALWELSQQVRQIAGPITRRLGQTGRVFGRIRDQNFPEHSTLPASMSVKTCVPGNREDPRQDRLGSTVGLPGPVNTQPAVLQEILRLGH